MPHVAAHWGNIAEIMAKLKTLRGSDMSDPAKLHAAMAGMREQLAALGLTEREITAELHKYVYGYKDMFAVQNAKAEETAAHEYLPWYLGGIPILGNMINMTLAIGYGDFGMAVMYESFMLLDAVTLGTGKLLAVPLEAAIERRFP